ncbi:hypothetical protein BJ138DRAFT_979795, partial [Hygrophoropsis aurantiaca]
RTKDEIRITVGLNAKVWAETRGGGSADERMEGLGMVEGEVSSVRCFASCLCSMDIVLRLGRILILPIHRRPKCAQPDLVLLLTLNASADVEWGVMQTK